MSEVYSQSTGVGPSSSLEVLAQMELQHSTERSSEPAPLPALPPWTQQELISAMNRVPHLSFGSNTWNKDHEYTAKG